MLANDTDTDGGPKTIASAVQPAHGTVVITGDGLGLTYAPNANYCNSNPPASTDNFTYTLNGGSTATVAVTVTCAADIPPTAVNDTKTVTEDAGATAIDVLANDTDVDGGPKTIASVTQPANGTVAVARQPLAHLHPEPGLLQQRIHRPPPTTSPTRLALAARPRPWRSRSPAPRPPRASPTSLPPTARPTLLAVG